MEAGTRDVSTGARGDDHTEGRGFPQPRVSVVLKDGASECHQVPPLWRTAPEVVDVQVVEGKGFEASSPRNPNDLAHPVPLPVSWTREGAIKIAPPPSIVDPDATVRSGFIGQAAIAALRAATGV